MTENTSPVAEETTAEQKVKRNWFDRVLVGFFSVVLAIGSVALTLIIAGAATARYIFKTNFYGYEEIAVLVAFWVYFMGAAYGAYNNTHVSADVVDAYFPEGPAKRLLTTIRWTACVLICGLFAWYGYDFFSFGFKGPLGTYMFKPTSMVWRIPLWTSYLAIFAGLIFMELYFFRNMIMSIISLVKPPETRSQS